MKSFAIPLVVLSKSKAKESLRGSLHQIPGPDFLIMW